MKSLREQVGERDGFNCVAGGDEGAQITRQRGRVAGDVDQRGSGDCGEQRGDLRAEAGAGRVDDDEFGRLGGPCAAQKLQRVAIDGLAACAAEIVHECGS